MKYVTGPFVLSAIEKPNLQMNFVHLFVHEKTFFYLKTKIFYGIRILLVDIFVLIMGEIKNISVVDHLGIKMANIMTFIGFQKFKVQRKYIGI